MRAPARRPRFSGPGFFALLVLPFLSLSCGAPVPETRFLNFDSESTPASDLSGFSSFEKGPGNDSFVWCQARRGTVTVNSRGEGDRLLRIRLWPFRYPGAPPQAVEVSLNGVGLGSRTLLDGPTVYWFTTPRAAWRKGRNEIALSFRYAEAPRDRVSGSGDARTLAAAVDWLEILPLPGS